MPTRKRNYRKEYASYHAKPAQVKRRAVRNAARAKLMKAGRVRKGDGKDVHHRRSLSNSPANLRVRSRSANRADNRRRR